jgi:hypothetical protein
VCRRVRRCNQLPLRIRTAGKQAGLAFGFAPTRLPQEGEGVTRLVFTFRLDKEKSKKGEVQDRRYLLRSNLVGENASVLRERYVQLAQMEARSRTLKNGVGVWPTCHQVDKACGPLSWHGLSSWG